MRFGLRELAPSDEEERAAYEAELAASLNDAEGGLKRLYTVLGSASLRTPSLAIRSNVWALLAQIYEYRRSGGSA